MRSWLVWFPLFYTFQTKQKREDNSKEIGGKCDDDVGSTGKNQGSTGQNQEGQIINFKLLQRHSSIHQVVCSRINCVVVQPDG